MPNKDKQKQLAYQREWARKNPERTKEAYYRSLAKHPENKLLKSSKQNAKARGLEHTISKEDIKVPKICPYLKIELTTEVQQKNTASTVSLDRIDNTKGYTPDNIQVISRLANLMKSYATEEQLIQFAKSVLEIHGE